MIEFRDEIPRKHKTIYIYIIVLFIIILITIIASQLLKYQVEGEQNLPFNINQILIISTADGIPNSNTDKKWDFSILQNNDVYIEVEKKVPQNDSLNRIILGNFNIISYPQKGEPKFYHPIDDKDLIFIYNDENIINDEIVFNVSDNSNLKKLSISQDRGIVAFSYCSTNIATYSSNDDTEITYDGKLLNKVNISEAEVKSELSFDLIVEMQSNKKYKTTINLQLPLDNFTRDGIIQHEITDFSNLIFKRV